MYLSFLDIHIPFMGKIPIEYPYRMVKNPPPKAGDVRDTGLIPGSGKSPGRGNGTVFQYSSLENSTVRGAWQAIIRGGQKELDITQHTHMAFHVCLLSLNIMLSSYIHIVAYIRTSCFLQSNHIHLYGCTTLYLSIDQLIDIWVVSTF